MIPHGKVKIGDTVLYQRRKKIMEWEVVSISPSQKYIEIENDDWSERWVYIGDLLEIMNGDGAPELKLSSSKEEIIEYIENNHKQPIARWDAKNRK